MGPGQSRDDAGDRQAWCPQRRHFPFVAVDVEGVESQLKEWKGKDVRGEIIGLPWWRSG